MLAAMSSNPETTAISRKKNRHGLREYADCAEAFGLLLLSFIAVRLVPFGRAMRWMSGGPGVARPDAGPQAALTAIVRVEHRLNWRPTCLVRAMALQLMLRRRGLSSQLVYGLANDPQSLRAHAWIMLDGQILAGGEEAAAYCEVARFPPNSGSRL